MYYSNECNRNTQTISQICMDGPAIANRITTSSLNNHQNDNGNIRIDVANKNIYRPTYGAYLHKSLPRGPYLQYKFNDCQSTQLLEQHQIETDNDNNRLLQIQQNKSKVIMKNSAKTSTITAGNKISTTLPHTQMITVKDVSTTTISPLADRNSNKIANNEIPNLKTENKMLYDLAKSQFICNSDDNTTTIKNKGHHHHQHHIQHNPHELEICQKYDIETNIDYHKINSSNNNKFDIVTNQQKYYFTKQPEINSNYFRYENDQMSQDDFLNRIQGRNSNNEFVRIMTDSKFENFCDRHNDFYSLPNVSNNLNEFHESKQLTCQVNYITLADVIQAKPEGLNESEGWAILCQAVQALQDMFLADFPATSRILPLVRTSTIQITSRGRVVFSIITVGQLDKFNDVTSYFDVTDHLSPEYCNSLGKKVVFAESDMEKMWIYSLGIALRSAINIENEQNVCKRLQFNHRNTGEFCNNHSLVDVIDCMCKTDIHRRASLMYLLDLNTERTTLRRKPQSIPSLLPEFDEKKFNFNKIKPEEKIIELEYEGNSITLLINNSPLTVYHSLICPQIKDNLPQILTKDAIKFSIEFLRVLDDCNFRIGYNSAGALASVNHLHLHLLYLQQDLYTEYVVISLFCRSQKQMKPFSHIVMEIFQFVTTRLQRIKEINHNTIVAGTTEVTQLSDGVRSETDSGRGSAYDERADLIIPPSTDTHKSCLKVKQDNCGTIGYTGIKYLQKENLSTKQNQIQVFRRNRKDILRRRNDFRRNTVDVSLFEVEKAKEIQYLPNLSLAKSMECIDKYVNCDSSKFKTNVSPLPDLCPQIQKASSNLKVHHNKIHFKDKILRTRSNESFLEKGPEFMLNLKSSLKEVCITDLKCHHLKTLYVLLLDGQTIRITCNSITTTTHQILEAIFQTEHYIENFFLGLCALIGDDFVFLPHDLKIYKVAPQAWINTVKRNLSRYELPNFTLYIRVKYLLPSLRGMSSLESRHMLYLQLRKSILERNILCTEDDLITLGGLALQAEIGDFKESMKYHGEYFTISHYLPEGVHHRNKEMVKYLRNSHFCRRGLHPKEAELNFIKYVQEIKEYGFHLYSAIWTTEDGSPIDVYVGISLGGMALFERNNNRQITTMTTEMTRITAIQQPILTSSSSSALSSSSSLSEVSGINSKMSYQRKLYMSFEWLEIENLCYSKHILCIVVRKSESLKAKNNNRVKYKLKMDGRKSYFAFSLASEHHQFYMKLRNSFISLKSLSAKLNIPITSYIFEDKMSTTEIRYSSTHQTNSKSSSSPSSISSFSYNNPTSTTMMAMTKTNDKNTNFEHQYECHEQGTSGVTLPENIKKIDKQLKASGLRVRNLKKSMLNDNRLTKLKDRLLKRSKSTAGTIIEKVTSTMTQNKNTKDGKFSSKKQQNQQYPLKNETKIKRGVDENCENGDDDGSKEVNQNKENEYPIKIFTDGNESPKVVYSPNRNRVKMGTRVFSSQFLNKSFDNIYEQATLNICQFESTNSIDKDSMGDGDDDGRSGNRRTDSKKEYDGNDNKIESNDYDNQSLNNSQKSLHLADKLPNKSKFNDSISPSTEAFVIHSSIKSDRDLHYNFTLPNETVSESLLEKFNNISCSSNSNNNDRMLAKLTVVKERLNHLKNLNEGTIKALRVVASSTTIPTKKILNTKPNTSDLYFNKMERDPIKYATFNHRMVKEYYKNDGLFEEVKYGMNSINNKNNRKNDIHSAIINTGSSNSICDNIRRYSSSLGLRLPLSRSQESIFIDNKFSVVDDDDDDASKKRVAIENEDYTTREGAMAINQKNMENDLDGFTLGISIVQGTDNNVYVKDLVKNGPGDKAGIRIGDQIIAVNGISLLNLSYAEALKKLQNTGLVVELIVSQILNRVTDNVSKTPTLIMNSTPLTSIKKDSKPLKRTQSSIIFNSNDNNPSYAINYSNSISIHDANGFSSITPSYSTHDTYLKQIRFATDDVCHTSNMNEVKEIEIQSKYNGNGTLTPAKSMPDLPKVVAIIPKRVIKYGDNSKHTYPRTAGQSRKYLGPVRYPVTPFKTTILSPHRQQLSLLADSDDDLVYI